MLFGSNSTRVFVAKNCVRTATVTTANMATELGQGEIIVTDEKGAILATAAAAKKAKAIRLHVGIGDGKSVVSDIIRAKDISKYLGTKFIQEIEKRVYIGYNGTAGTIQLIDSNEYRLIVENKSTSPAQMAHPLVNTVSYKSSATGVTQLDIANGLVQLLTLNYAQFEPAIKAHVIADGTIAAASVTGASVTTGSTVFTYTGGAATIGDVLVVPGKVDAVYGNELNTLYQVIGVDTVNKVITVDKPYQNVSQTGISFGTITAITNAGIVLEGVRPSFRLGYGDLVMIDWDTMLSNFGTTLFTKVEGIHPNGRHEQVGMAENLFQGTAGRRQSER